MPVARPTPARGTEAGTLASSPSMSEPVVARPEKRAYFVWRLARFHGGADVTLPITATGRLVPTWRARSTRVTSSYETFLRPARLSFEFVEVGWYVRTPVRAV